MKVGKEEGKNRGLVEGNRKNQGEETEGNEGR
jgi:hypothetical protein